MAEMIPCQDGRGAEFTAQELKKISFLGNMAASVNLVQRNQAGFTEWLECENRERLERGSMLKEDRRL